MNFLQRGMNSTGKRVCVWDLETQNHTYKERVASPFDPRNYIVASGWSYNGGQVSWLYANSKEESDSMDMLPDLTGVDVIVGHNISFDLLWEWKHPRLIEFFKRGGEIYCTQMGEYYLNGMERGSHFNSMGDVAKRYPEHGGGGKLDEVKDMWNRGILTEDIPEHMLLEYLVGSVDYGTGGTEPGDIRNTWAMFAGQLTRMETMHPNFFTMVRTRMDGRLGTTEMEYNGVHCNRGKGTAIRTEVSRDVDTLKAELDGYIPLDMPPELKFNWGSPQMKSAIIFGGSIGYKKWIPHLDGEGQLIFPMKTEKLPMFRGNLIPEAHCKWLGDAVGFVVPCPPTMSDVDHPLYGSFMLQDRVKGGKTRGQLKYGNFKSPNLDKPKGAQQLFAYRFKGYTKPEARWKTQSLDAEGAQLYSTDKKVVEKLMGKTTDVPFLKSFMDYNKAVKDLDTYYWKEDADGNAVSGMMTQVGEDGIIHHYINHCATVTARNSSSKPNLQTIGRKGTSRFKQSLDSRFGADGRMVEVDYSQLEVVNQGVLTEDTQLRIDLQNGVDFHIKRLTALMNEAYEVLYHKHHVLEDPVIGEARTGAKKYSFLSQYGGGIDTIVYDTGMPKEQVEKLAKADDTLYPGIKPWYDQLEYLVESSALPCGEFVFINGDRLELRRGYYDLPEGTRLTWIQHETPDFVQARGKLVGFSPTERKNYPCQSLGGHIMQCSVGLIWRWGLSHDFCNGDMLIVNTVHDCIWLDCRTQEIAEFAAKAVRDIMQATPQIFNSKYGMHIDVPYPAEAEIGADMYDMTKFH